MIAPSLLLLTTLFRLAINVSVTRLILLDGDAGNVVHSFGSMVVGGNLVHVTAPSTTTRTTTPAPTPATTPTCPPSPR